jgi:phosphoglycerate dehydrogenase-like enzyme
VVELAALTPANRGIVSSALLERLRPDSVFVNIARGALVDEEALVRLARTGQVWIGLDVYAQEPLPSDSPLRGLENVCLSPHLAGPTTDQWHHCGEYALANILAFQQGETPKSLINLDVYDRST